MGNVRFWKLGGGGGSDVSSGSVWGPSLAIPSLKMDCSQLGHDGLFFRLVILSWRVGTPSRFLYLSGLICSTFVQLYSFRIMCDTLRQPSEITNLRNPLLQSVHVLCCWFRCAWVLGRGVSHLLFLGLLLVVARVLRAGLGNGFSRGLFGVSYVVGYFRLFVTAIGSYLIHNTSGESKCMAASTWSRSPSGSRRATGRITASSVSTCTTSTALYGNAEARRRCAS